MATIIKRKKDGSKQVVVNTAKTQTVPEKQDILTLYQKRFTQYQLINSGPVTIGNRNKGKDCITVASLEKQDILQDAIISLLNTQKKEYIENTEHLFNRAISCTRKNYAKKALRGSSHKENQEVSRFIEFSSTIAEIESDKQLDPEDKTSYKETIDHITQNLNPTQKTLFVQYFLEGHTVREIADSLQTDKMQVSRMLTKIKNKIHRLKISEIYDHRFIAPSTPETCPAYPYFTPEKKPLDSGRHVDIADYQPQVKKPLQSADIEYADALDIAIPLQMDSIDFSGLNS